MRLKASKYVSGYSFSNDEGKKLYAAMLAACGLTIDDVDKHTPSGTINLTVAYWRKANAIHNWFIQECAGGEDDCRPVHVRREQLEELLNLAKDASKAYNDGNKDKAGEILQPVGGFFFGSTDINEWYLEDLKSTISQLEKILNNPKFKDWDFEYQASW